MHEYDRGEEEADYGEVGCPQDWVAVEDCDEDAHIGGKQGEEDPSLLKIYCNGKGDDCASYPVKSEPELGGLRTMAQEGVK